MAHVAVVVQPVSGPLHVWSMAPLHCTLPVVQGAAVHAPAVALQCAADAQVMVVTHPSRSALQTCSSGPEHCMSPVWQVVGVHMLDEGLQSAAEPHSC